MGFSDKVTLDGSIDDIGILKGRTFETKSLYAAGGEFTITADRLLNEHIYRFETNPTFDPVTLKAPLWTRFHIEDKLIDYHGDILLLGTGPQGHSEEFVARFTYGRLEWIRRATDYPEANRKLLVEQGAR